MPKITIPKVIGHRGAKAYAPENTLASIHTAADMGIEWVEVDVKLTKDGVPVIFHDEELERCTGAEGLMCDLDFKSVRELDAGSWFGESFVGEKIPTLEEVLTVVLDRNMGINLEIKPCPGREVETAEIMLDVATRFWPEDQPPPLVSSFSHVSLETALHMMPDWPRGLLIDDQPENWQELIEYLEVTTININGNNTTRDMVDEYIELQKPVLAYTINDPMRAQELLRWGVDSVFSDNPDVIREALERFH